MTQLSVHNLKSSLGGEIQTWPTYMEGKERQKKEADHSRSVGGRVNKEGKSHTRLVMGGHKTS